MISKERLASCAVDEDISRRELGHRLLRRHDRRGALQSVRLARVDQIAEGALDGVERTEAERPLAKKRHQVRRDGPSERESLFELWWIEDGEDVVSVNVIGA